MSKFKLNWSHFVMIGLGSFMIFILTLIFLAGDTGELVTEDYYQHSLNYQEETIDASKRTHNLQDKPSINFQANGILITFPDDIKVEKGEIQLMRGASASQDIVIPIQADKKEVLIPATKLKSGEYDMFLRWTMNNKTYLIKKTIQWTSH